MYPNQLSPEPVLLITFGYVGVTFLEEQDLNVKPGSWFFVLESNNSSYRYTLLVFEMQVAHETSGDCKMNTFWHVEVVTMSLYRFYVFISLKNA